MSDLNLKIRTKAECPRTGRQCIASSKICLEVSSTLSSAKVGLVDFPSNVAELVLLKSLSGCILSNKIGKGGSVRRHAPPFWF